MSICSETYIERVDIPISKLGKRISEKLKLTETEGVVELRLKLPLLANRKCFSDCYIIHEAKINGEPICTEKAQAVFHKKIIKDLESKGLVQKSESMTLDELYIMGKQLLEEYYGKGIKVPTIKITHAETERSLGSFVRRVDIGRGKCSFYIKLQKALLTDRIKTRRVLLHELIHYVDFLRHALPLVKNRDVVGYERYRRRDSHGGFFREEMNHINDKVKGKFITVKSENDKDYIEESGKIKKKFYVLLYKSESGDCFSYSHRLTDRLLTKYALLIKNKKGKIFESRDINWTKGNKGGQFYLAGNKMELFDELYDSGEEIDIKDLDSKSILTRDYYLLYNLEKKTYGFYHSGKDNAGELNLSALSYNLEIIKTNSLELREGIREGRLYKVDSGVESYIKEELKTKEVIPLFEVREMIG